MTVANSPTPDCYGVEKHVVKLYARRTILQGENICQVFSIIEFLFSDGEPVEMQKEEVFRCFSR